MAFAAVTGLRVKNDKSLVELGVKSDVKLFRGSDGKLNVAAKAIELTGLVTVRWQCGAWSEKFMKKKKTYAKKLRHAWSECMCPGAFT